LADIVDQFIKKHPNFEFSGEAERKIKNLEPKHNPDRRVFLQYIGAGVAGIIVGAIGTFLLSPPRIEEKTVTTTVTPAAGEARTVTTTVTKIETVTTAPQPIKQPIPTTPIKIGHVHAFTGPAAVLGESTTLAIRYLEADLNAKGGILGRQITHIEREQGSKTDEAVKEIRKIALEDKVDLSISTIGSGMAVATAPVCNELGLLQFYPANRTADLLPALKATGSTTFRTCRWDAGESLGLARAAMKLWPEAKKVAYIQPDYAYGRDIYAETSLFWKKFLPGFEIVAEAWPPLYSTDYTPHIVKVIESKPDILYTSLWGGDWVTFLKQAKGYGLFQKIPHIIAGAGQESFHGPGTETPEGILAGVRYHWLWPPHELWPPQRDFVQGYYAMHKKYPYYTGEAAWTALMAYKNAVEYLYAQKGRWPDTPDIVKAIENMWLPAPGGWVQLREDHELVCADVNGITKYDPNIAKRYPGAGVDFPILDPVFVSPAEEIIPPTGMHLKDWIASW
jgi:branched-chain amino acid transport system substrate-binding protein